MSHLCPPLGRLPGEALGSLPPGLGNRGISRSNWLSRFCATAQNQGQHHPLFGREDVGKAATFYREDGQITSNKLSRQPN